ncbi:ISAs1 family transposase [Actinoplanes derwentensis]|uniref:Transposase DDE domain-containing protein n=1 Tax=Actinoplanes derwentensis TaxID=113562 RepID=A0A1H2D8N4_9ACTN|nr:ISAs1 family transposase [Actinoplanes derwentensis]GID89694.1 ISAs1 family transposase [Actinoplanes derwentensis]SDT78917.1 Transposase DDE domain-containing protein [Actinoplanes derwentensis]
MPQSAILVTDPSSAPLSGDLSFTPSCHGLLDLVLAVGDGRSDQGRDHPVAVVLALVAAATVAGLKGYTAISGRVADVPTDVLDSLYLRAEARPAGRPSRSTLWRVCTDTDGDVLDTVIAEWTTTRHAGSDTPSQVRLDGKTVRGSAATGGEQLHLIAALTGAPGPDPTAVIIAQTPTDGAKTREPEAARALLETLDLRDVTVTADALHTVKATADLIHQQGGHFVLPVKQNRAALFDSLDALPWAATPIGHESTETGHGRTTRRTIRVLPAPPGLRFPHVKQVWLIERYVTTSDGKQSAIAQLGITSHPAETAGPAAIAAFNRGQWAIETLHFIRDTCYREDQSRIRTRSGPRVLASLRNLAINALRLAGRTDITEATRWAGRDMTRPFTILGLTR